MIILLVDQRRPGVFISKTFCAIHATMYPLFVRSYPLAVLLLCVARTISIMHPFYRIKKRLVIATIYIFATLIGSVRMVQYFSGSTIIYGSDGPFCYPFHDISIANDSNDIKTKRLLRSAKFVLWSVIVLVPALASIVSLTLILRKLMSRPVPSRQDKHGNRHQDRQRKAATTVFIFTGVFLLFYTPVLSFFIYTAVASFTSSGIFSQYFMFWYSWTICEVLNLLNAMCDFVVYFARMKDFRSWLIQRWQVES